MQGPCLHVMLQSYKHAHSGYSSACSCAQLRDAQPTSEMYDNQRGSVKKKRTETVRVKVSGEGKGHQPIPSWSIPCKNYRSFLVFMRQILLTQRVTDWTKSEQRCPQMLDRLNYCSDDIRAKCIWKFSLFWKTFVLPPIWSVHLVFQTIWHLNIQSLKNQLPITQQ